MQLKYSQIPAKLHAIAEMSDLDVLLGNDSSNDGNGSSGDSTDAHAHAHAHSNANADSSQRSD